MSENFKIVDKDKKAEWVINTSDARVPDYVRHSENPGTELIIIEPGVPTKIILSDYLKGQEVLKLIEDPTQSEGIVFKVEKAAELVKTDKAAA